MKNKIEIILLSILFLITAFLRLYKIDQLTIFNYDQARDALFTKRIVVDHKFRLIGPQSSPGFYTGPAYYYLMAPFLWITDLSPSGMDIGVAVMNIVAVSLLYLLLKKITGNLVISFALSFLYSIQPQIVSQSRFSWNPNLTPLFMILFLLGLDFVLEKRTWGWIISAISLGFLIQLHFTTLSLIPMVFLFIYICRKKKVFDRNFILSGIIFLLMLSPFLIVELRHNFPNTNYLLKFLTVGPSADLPPTPLFLGILEKLKFLLAELPFGIKNNLASIFSVVTVLILFVFVTQKRDQKENSFLIICPVVLVILMSFVYRYSFFQYYLTFLFPIPFLILGFIFSYFTKRKVSYLFLLLFVPLIFFNINQDKEVFSKTSIESNFQKVAFTIGKDNGVNSAFNLVSVSNGDGYYNGVNYRYYLETFYNKQALDWDILGYQNSKTLYVISNVGEFDPLNSNIWEIGLFEPKKLVQKWTTDNSIIYKLTK